MRNVVESLCGTLAGFFVGHSPKEPAVHGRICHRTRGCGRRRIHNPVYFESEVSFVIYDFHYEILSFEHSSKLATQGQLKTTRFSRHAFSYWKLTPGWALQPGHRESRRATKMLIYCCFALYGHCTMIIPVPRLEFEA
jgi:hypothetical protein